jgi:fluoride exporter
MTPVWISLAGGIGALSRFIVDGHIRTKLYRGFPWGTTLVNASGSLLLGVLTGLVLYHHLNGDTKLIWGTGFCGGYTTFSTTSFEAVRLIEEKRVWAAAVHVCTNAGLALCLGAIGLWLAHSL